VDYSGDESKMSITEEIAAFIVETDYCQMSGEVVRVGRQAIADGLAVALAGCREPASMIIREYVREQGGRPESIVIGDGTRTSASLAALANGIAVHVLAFDDVSHSWLGHPAAVLVPAVLALGEKCRISGKAVLEAYILGCEVGAKIGRVVAAKQFERGWHVTSSLGSLASAVAAAKILRLDLNETRMAIGIAASEASGLRANFGSMTKALHPGLAARNGVVASILAKKGFSANENIVENDLGFIDTFAGGEEHNLVELSASLGAPFDLVSPGLTIKPYPCCRMTHSCIDAVLHLNKEHHFSVEDIARVECITSGLAQQIATFRYPRTVTEAKLSMQYGIAMALLDGEVVLSQFTDTRIQDPKVQALMRKIEHVSGRDMVEENGEVIIKLQDGRECSHIVCRPKGDPMNPMSEKELLSKWQDCASLVLSPENVEKFLTLVLSFESLEDIMELAEVLRQARADA
jgi:2-methylcitrate dehydratase PrpD